MTGAYANAEAGTRHVFVSGLEIMTIIGVHDEERRAPQRIIVSVDLKVREAGPARSDRLADVLDYSGVVRLVEPVAVPPLEIENDAIASLLVTAPRGGLRRDRGSYGGQRHEARSKHGHLRK